MKSFLIKAGIRILSNKTVRRTILVIAGFMLFLFIVGPIATKVTAITALGNLAKSVVEFFSGSGEIIDPATMTEDDWLRAFEKGYEMEEGDKTSMAISQEDFIYLLERVRDYNKAGEKTREITIEGERVYIEIVNLPDTTDPETGEVSPGGTEERERIEHPTKTIEVSNSEYEGMDHLDYRLLYYFCLLPTIKRGESDLRLKTIQPKDADRNPITHWEEVENVGGYFVTREDIDRVFSYITIDYQYYFDVLRDSRTFYSFEDCQNLPHEESITGIAGTTIGETTYYIPKSYLISGDGQFSRIESTLNADGTMLTATKAVFRFETMIEAMRSLYSNFSWDELSAAFENIPGGTALLAKYKEWGDVGHTFKTKSGLKTIISKDWVYHDTGSSYTSSSLGLTSSQQDALSAMWMYLTDTLGYPNAVAAGICGNCMQESSFKATLGQNGGSAIGIFQWADERKTALLAMTSPWTLATQLEFFNRELLSSGYLASLNSYAQTYFGKAFTNLDDPVEAAEAFCVAYEGCIYDPAKGYGKRSSPTASIAASNGKRYQDLQTRIDYAISIYETMSFGGYSSLAQYDGTDLPYYHQSGEGAEEWSGYSLGIGTISGRGCSLCAGAMAASYCLHKVVKPQDLASIPEVYAWTSSHKSMNHEPYQMAFRSLGVKYRVLDPKNLKAEITEALIQHHPVMLSVCAGSYGFTKNTHYIVLRYMDSKGGVHLHDSSHPENSSKVFDLDEILTQLNNYSGIAECYPN